MRRYRVNSSAVLLPLVVASCVSGPPKGLKPVDSVTLVGAHPDLEDEILDGLTMREPKGIIWRDVTGYSPVVLSIDRKRIESFYRSKGYFSAKVTRARAKPFAGGEAVDVRYVIEEGKQSILGSVSFTVVSSSATSLSEMHTLADLEIGEPIDYAKHEDAKERIRAALAEKSHTAAKVDSQVAVDRDLLRADVHYFVDPGPLYRFGTTTASTSSLPQDSILGRIAWDEGDLYRPSLVRVAEGRMYELSLASSVRVAHELKLDNTVDVTLSVSDAEKNELKVGGGFEFDSVNLIGRVRLGYTRREFFHPLWTLSTDLRPEIYTNTGNPGFSGSATMIRDDFLVPRLQLKTGVNYALVQYEAFNVLGFAGQVGVARPFVLDRLELGLTFLTGTYIVGGINDSIPLDGRQMHGLDNYQLLSLNPSVSLDLRDNPLNPHNGYLMTLPIEFGRAFGSASATFFKLTPQISGYWSLGTPRIVLGARLRFGYNLLDKPLPATLRYFAGGATTERGFGGRQLSPGYSEVTKGLRTGKWLPVGGEALVLANAELRFEIVRLWGNWLGFVTFVDAGDVADTLRDLELAPPHLATGGGFRYLTPVGPIRLDVGYRLNRQGIDEPAPTTSTFSRFRFHISIGEAF